MRAARKPRSEYWPGCEQLPASAFLSPAFFHDCSRKLALAAALSCRPKAQHAVGFVSRQSPLDQHVVDMRDELAGSKAHLVHVERILMEHDGHQFPRGFR